MEWQYSTVECIIVMKQHAKRLLDRRHLAQPSFCAGLIHGSQSGAMARVLDKEWENQVSDLH